MKVLGRSDREGNSIIIRFRGNNTTYLWRKLFPSPHHWCRHFIFIYSVWLCCLFYITLSTFVVVCPDYGRHSDNSYRTFFSCFFLFRRRRRSVVYICYLIHVTLTAAHVVHGKCFLDPGKKFWDFNKKIDNPKKPSSGGVHANLTYLSSNVSFSCTQQ